MSSSDFNVNINGDSTIASDISSESIINADIQVESDISVSVSLDGNIDVSLQSYPYTDAQFGVIYQIETDNRILYATTETWNSQSLLIARRGFIYVYSDGRTDDTGRVYPAIKIGDGKAYLIDMPFVDDMYYEHINDVVSHITQEEREFWNNKVRCYMSEDDTNLIFTTN